MALFDRKPLIVGGQVIFSPKDLSSGEKAYLIAIKSLQMLMMFGSVGLVAGLFAGMLRFTFDFPWSWGVFFVWGIVSGFASIISVGAEFLSWWWITDKEAQQFRNYYDQMSKKMESFMKDNGIDYEPLSQDTTTKDDDEGEKIKAKVIPISTPTSRKKPNDDQDKEKD